jgi:tryptophanyl-tRNA synthetase
MSVAFSGSLGLTGSLVGNVVTVTAAAQTASINLNAGSAFMFYASSSAASASLFRLTNIPTGSNQKFSLIISQSVAGGANVFFDDTFRMPSGSAYVVSTTTGSVDILTFELYPY